MPLADHIPKIDDRSYDSIVAEMRARISRYTPEWKPAWTDLNDSDPGITMLQVFAWLGEMLAFRMNRVPELNHLKFLQLLGIELRPREPAQAEITFPVRTTHPAPTAIVPRGTQVIAETPGGGPPLVFEATRALVCLTARLGAVLAYDGYSYEPVTEANQGATGFLPLGPTANVDSALLLGFDATLPFPGTDLTFFVWSAAPERRDVPVACGLPPSPAYGPASLRWEYWSGFEWAPLTLMKDDSLAFTRSGEIVVRTPAASLATTVIPPETTARYWIRARVERSQYERPPRLLAVRTNTMRLTQMETVQQEVLGGSNGRRDQVFTLDNTPVLEGSLHLRIDQGSGFEDWTEVPDFFGSGANDPHYALNRTTGEIRFGDGFRGAIPVANVANPSANVVRARALPLHHPEFPGVQVPGVITVVVVPDSDAPNPMPSEGTLRTVCAYLDQRRLLTSEVYVVPPDYQRVRVTVEVTAQGSADLAAVHGAVERALLDYFHPLSGGEDGHGWPFGGPILYSRVVQRVLAVPGVDSIRRLVIAIDGEEGPECRDLQIRDGALVYSTEHEVSVGYAVATGGAP